MELISREQAIEVLERAKQNIRHNIERAIGRAICEILDEIENAIKQLPSTNCSEIPNNSDLISRQAVIETVMECYDNDELFEVYEDKLRELPPAQHEVVRCKDCKHFEYDHVENINGIPLIVAHEICMRWGDGVKTSENGYCFLAERREVTG